MRSSINLLVRRLLGAACTAAVALVVPVAAGAAEPSLTAPVLLGSSSATPYALSATVRIPTAGGPTDGAALVFDHRSPRSFRFVSFAERNDRQGNGIFEVRAGRVRQLVDFTAVTRAGVVTPVRIERTATGVRAYRGGVLLGRADRLGAPVGRRGWAVRGDGVRVARARITGLDVTAPVTTIVAGPAPGDQTYETEATFRFAAAERSTFACRLDAGAFAPCASVLHVRALAAGEHVLAVRATDVAGNVQQRPTQRRWTVLTRTPTGDGSEGDDGSGPDDAPPPVEPPPTDTTPPVVTLLDGPGEGVATAATGAVFSFLASEAATFSCRLDDAAWTTCASPFAYADLPVGAHVWRVRATDAAGNASVVVTRSWTIVEPADTTPPVVTVTAGPAEGSTTTSTSASLEFDASETATFECRLDSGGWVACTSPRALSGLGLGGHAWSVRARDVAGNLSAAATRSWTVAVPADTTAPTVTITAGPVDGSSGASTSAVFGFTANEAATFQCRRNSGAWASCVSPQSYTGVPVGAQTWSVRATDAAGNVSATVTRSWTVTAPADTTAPNITVTSGPAHGSSTTSTGASFAFAANEAAAFECRRDAGGWAACASPDAMTELVAGAHSWAVRATDAAGNTSATTTRSWTVTVAPDTTAPTMTITGGQAAGSSTTATFATFEFTASEAVTAQCRIDSGSYVPCTSPVEFLGIAAGNHTFQVRGIDRANNTGVAASRSWTVTTGADTTAPTAAITAGPAAGSSSTSPGATFEMSSTEAGSFHCRLDSAAWAACTSPKAYVALRPGSHTFEARAVDASGNVSAGVWRTWTVLAPPDATAPVVTVTGGPAAGSSSPATSAAFAFASDESANFQCRLDAGAWGACASPREYTGLAPGAHAFEVRGTDAANNTSAPTSRTWNVTSAPGGADLDPPTTALAAAPGQGTVTTSSTATLAFSSPDATASFQCRLDDEAWATCTSPRVVTGLPLGVHTFDVRAIDAAGNVDPSPVSRIWTTASSDPGTVKPGAANTGVPAGTVLTPHAGNLVITTPGTVVDALDVQGVVQIKAADVTIRRTRVRGNGQPTSGFQALVSNYVAGATNAVIEDSTLVLDAPYLDGNNFMGGNMTFRRVESAAGTDTGGVSLGNVTVESSWLHDSTTYERDPGHANGRSHNDGIQVHGGANYNFTGNTIERSYNAAIMVNQGTARTTALVIDENWIDGGACSVNIAPANAFGTAEVTMRGNRFGRDTFYRGCAIKVNPTSPTFTASGNVWADTGAAVATSTGP